MQKSVKKWIACGLALALVLTSMIPTQSMQAASKPKLSATKKTMVVGSRTSLKVSNKVKNAKYVWKTSKKSVVRVSSKGSVKAAAKGSAVISCSVKVKNKTKYTLKCKVTVTDQKVVKTQKELNSALKNSKITGITLKTNANTKFTIAAGSYTNKNLIVDAPNADVVNNGVFKSIKIKNIKSDTWTENAKGNKIDVTAKSARVVVAENASVSSFTCSKSDSKVTLEVNGTVKTVKVTKMADISVKVSGTVDNVTVDAASAKVDMNVEKDGTVTIVNMNASAQLNVKAEGKVEGVKINSFAQVTIEGNTEKVIVTVTEAGEGASLTSSVPVEVTTSSNVSVKLEKGAEGSAIKTTTDKVEVAVKNESQSQVTITTPTGTEKVEVGESTTGSGSGSTTDSNSGNGGSSGGSDNNGGGSTTTKVTGVTVTPSDTKLLINQEITLEAKVTGEGNPAQTVTWTTSDEKVATVDKDGKVTAVGAGEATITATSTVDTKVSGTCKVTVSDKPSISLTETNLNIKVGDTAKLTATTIPETADVTWTVDKEGFVTVTGTGKEVEVVGVAVGDVTITVAIDEDTKATCKVTVNAADVDPEPTKGIAVKEMSNNIYNSLFSATGTSITIPASGASITLDKVNATDVASLGAITSTKVENKTIKVEGTLNKIGNQHFVAIEITAANATSITSSQAFVVKKEDGKYAVIIAVSEQNKTFTIAVTEGNTSTDYTIDATSCTLN